MYTMALQRLLALECARISVCARVCMCMCIYSTLVSWGLGVPSRRSFFFLPWLVPVIRLCWWRLSHKVTASSPSIITSAGLLSWCTIFPLPRLYPPPSFPFSSKANPARLPRRYHHVHRQGNSLPLLELSNAMIEPYRVHGDFTSAVNETGSLWKDSLFLFPVFLLFFHFHS